MERVRNLEASREPALFALNQFHLKFDRQMSSDANDIANVLPFAACRDHEWGHVAVYRT